MPETITQREWLDELRDQLEHCDKRDSLAAVLRESIADIEAEQAKAAKEEGK